MARPDTEAQVNGKPKWLSNMAGHIEPLELMADVLIWNGKFNQALQDPRFDEDKVVY